MDNTGKLEDIATLTAPHHFCEPQHIIGVAMLCVIAREELIKGICIKGNKQDRLGCPSCIYVTPHT